MNMTNEQIGAMQAGLEMDRAVAEACNIEHSAFAHCIRLKEKGRRGFRYFCPSSDWNDAMFALAKDTSGPTCLCRAILKLANQE